MGQVDVSLTLLSNAGAGNGASVKWPGGAGEICAIGTWGGGNLQLQALGPDGTTWVNVGSAITANGVAKFELGRGTVRGVVTTATGVYASLKRLLS